MKIKPLILSVTFCLISLLLFTKAQSQEVWENYRNEIYSYLSIMAQKGLIEFDDIIQPITRSKINEALKTLNNQKEKLSSLEKKELAFYVEEYAVINTSTSTHLFKNDENRRWRLFSASNRESNATLFVDPIVQIGKNTGNNNISFTNKSIGINCWGTIGKHIGFQFYGNDITLSGTGGDTNAILNSAPGYVKQSDSGNHQTVNYSDVRASVTYGWKNGSVSFGQDYLLWGYGENGRMVLSDKSPTYPYIRLDYRPFKWLQFNYIHAWLNSNMVDSSKTYSYYNTVYGGHRIYYIPKYMASHSVNIKFNKNFDVSIGESIIYSDQLNVGYLIPLMFFKVYDNIKSNGNILAGDNGQFFFQFNSRNWIKKTHIYAGLLIDEIRITKIFTDSNRNQLGLNLGISATDILIPHLTVTADYTRINPFVYNNLNPVQTYTSYGFNLGDWMGNNFDRFILSAKYAPFPKANVYIRYQYIRKGGAGTALQQYFVPEPPLLFDYQYSQSDCLAQFSYQPVHNVYLRAYLNYANQKRVNAASISQHSAGITFSYGL